MIAIVVVAGINNINNIKNIRPTVAMEIVVGVVELTNREEC